MDNFEWIFGFEKRFRLYRGGIVLIREAPPCPKLRRIRSTGRIIASNRPESDLSDAGVFISPLRRRAAFSVGAVPVWLGYRPSLSIALLTSAFHVLPRSRPPGWSCSFLDFRRDDLVRTCSPCKSQPHLASSSRCQPRG